MSVYFNLAALNGVEAEFADVVNRVLVCSVDAAGVGARRAGGRERQHANYGCYGRDMESHVKNEGYADVAAQTRRIAFHRGGVAARGLLACSTGANAAGALLYIVLCYR